MRSPTIAVYSLLIPLLCASNAVLWSEVYACKEPQLTVSLLSVGQGDAMLIEGPTGIQMLIDGGPDRSVLRRLPKEMGIFDRSIDMVVATHPDKDHIAGLPDVFARYRVTYSLSSGVSGESSFADAYEEVARVEPNVAELIARRGMRIHLGGGAYADVLYPDKQLPATDTNASSIVMRVVYRDTAFMLTGDAPSAVEDYLVAIEADDEALESTVLKAGHHGSRTSTGQAWLEAVDPDVVAVSAGKNNTYGHPATEVVERVKVYGATLVSTIDSGTLRFVSDGKTVVLK